MAHGVCITKQLEVLFANWRRTKCMRFSVMMTACGSVVLVLKIRLHRRRVRTEMNLTKTSCVNILSLIMLFVDCQ